LLCRTGKRNAALQVAQPWALYRPYIDAVAT
jgi:hypothetical protein